MKRAFMAALVAAGVLTSSSCLAALEYNYDQDSKIFTVQSEEVVPLEAGVNTLKVAFVKRYNFSPDKKGRVAKVVKPRLSLEMFVEGQQPYEFADNANYWQEHNYTYAEMTRLQAIATERQQLEHQQQAWRAADEAARQANDGKIVALTEEQQEERQALSQRDQELAKEQLLVQKDRLELGRNASTLIYLQVVSKLSRENTGKQLYDFEDPQKAQREADVQALTEHEREGVATMPVNKMDAELARQAAKEKQLQEQAEREKLAQLNADDPKAAAELRQKILDREAAAKIAAADAREAKVKSDVAKHAQIIEDVKATRAAFLKYQQEQAEAQKGMVYTSTATGKLSAGDNFFNKVRNSLQKDVPLFLEVKFWKGGANQRMWLQTDKLKELQELVDYDLYKDAEHLQEVEG